MQKRIFSIAILVMTIALSACSGSHDLAPVRDAWHSPNKRSTTITVRKGQTLYSIAWRFELDYRDLANINKLEPPYKLVPGQILQLRQPYMQMVQRPSKQQQRVIVKSVARQKLNSTAKGTAKAKHIVKKKFAVKTKHSVKVKRPIETKRSVKVKRIIKTKHPIKTKRTVKANHRGTTTLVTNTKYVHNTEPKVTTKRIVKAESSVKTNPRHHKRTTKMRFAKVNTAKGVTVKSRTKLNGRHHTASKSARTKHKAAKKITHKRIKLVKKLSKGRVQRVTSAKVSKNQRVKKLSPWAWPTSGRIIHAFSLAENRKGIDITGKKGQAIRASQAGTVAYCGNGLEGYGNLIIIKHRHGFLTAYAHNQRILVREGNKVKANQTIAEMGNSGSRRAMLHFEIRKAGKPVNPIRYLGHQ